MSQQEAKQEQPRRNLPTAWSIIIVLVIITAILLPRIVDLGAFQTADEKVWVANTQGFTKSLALLKFDRLLQQPHPGITTQWLGALAIHSDSAATRKLPLAIGQSILIVLIGYVFFRLWGTWPTILLTLLLALNPPLIAHTRVYAMDSLLALFSFLSIGCLLLWRKTGATRYLAFSAAASALAVLSKLPGVMIVPFVLILFAWWSWRAPDNKHRLDLVKNLGFWIAALLTTLIVIFPSLLLNFPEVKQLTAEFLLEGDAQEIHGQTSYTYYLKTLIFFSTPLHLATLLSLMVVLLPRVARRRATQPEGMLRGPTRSVGETELTEGVGGSAATGPASKEQALIFFLFAILFVVQMSVGAKKGDRYVLPSFLFLDALVVIAAMWLLALKQKLVTRTTIVILLIGISWQAIDIVRLHPYTLAYVNPLTKQLYGDRRLGWGEGFDLAATYLNEKPGAADLKVASLFPTEFAYNFVGNVIPLNHYDGANADYIILYRALLERGPDAWETNILNQFIDVKPERVITLNGLEYLWIYHTAPATTSLP